jgi:hypothetical protein
MKIKPRNPQHILSCGLSDSEVRDFERWANEMNLKNTNQTLRACIAYAIYGKKPIKQQMAEQGALTTV